jgi:hypothetical protein
MTDLTAYDASFDGDLALLAWWIHLGETGDLDRVFARDAHRLGMFLRQFEPPVDLVYVKDERGWAAVAWTWPLLSGCTFNLWVREDVRHHQASLQFVHAALTRAFERFPVVLFVTRSEAVRRQARYFGFQLSLNVPYLFDGDEALLGVATRFDFESATQPSNAGAQ